MVFRERSYYRYYRLDALGPETSASDPLGIRTERAMAKDAVVLHPYPRKRWNYLSTPHACFWLWQEMPWAALRLPASPGSEVF